MGSKIILFATLTAVLFAGFGEIAFAQETAKEIPAWFKIMEPVGAVFSILGLALSIINVKKFGGGKIGEAFMYLVITLFLFFIAFFWKLLTENGFVAGSMFSDAVFEVLLYGGIFFIVLSANTLRVLK